ncbi:MAG: hypothetical protein IPF64_09465 [Flavobacteriales bacterium]|nr:hypothetical protein [Flavobacteriales bacterium]
MDTQHRSEWDVVVEPSHGWWRIDLRELWHYRDLLVLMVKRDLLAVYKQTILGRSGRWCNRCSHRWYWP